MMNCLEKSGFKEAQQWSEEIFLKTRLTQLSYVTELLGETDNEMSLKQVLRDV